MPPVIPWYRSWPWYWLWTIIICAGAVTQIIIWTFFSTAQSYQLAAIIWPAVTLVVLIKSVYYEREAHLRADTIDGLLEVIREQGEEIQRLTSKWN